MNPSGNVTIVLADGHPFVREGIAALFRTKRGFEIVGECGDGIAALELITSLQPQFAVLDLDLPKLHGIEVVRKIRDTSCPTKIIVLSISRDEKMLKEVFRSGANGYLLKDGPARHLVDAISYVQDGGQYLTPLMPRERLGDSRKGQAGSPLASLSRREYEVFAFLVDGVRPKDIATLLNISPKTVDVYRANIMRKLGVHNIVGLVKFAIQRNLTSTDGATDSFKGQPE